LHFRQLFGIAAGREFIAMSAPNRCCSDSYLEKIQKITKIQRCLCSTDKVDTVRMPIAPTSSQPWSNTFVA